jgi:trimethylamine:corrinoid methyltransferase-like protein
MQRIDTLLEKLTELNRLKEKATIIDVDLMMDYTRVVYADLQEWRKRVEFTDNISTITQQPVSEHKHSDLKKSPSDNIEKLIGINDKYLFTTELFDNNNTVYLDTINILNGFDTYEQASNWLNSKYDWEEDNQAAIALAELLKSYYSNK